MWWNTFQGGLSKGYKNYVAEKEIQDETYQEDGVALFRVQGSGPENMQAIQVDPVLTFPEFVLLSVLFFNHAHTHGKHVFSEMNAENSSDLISW